MPREVKCVCESTPTGDVWTIDGTTQNVTSWVHALNDITAFTPKIGGQQVFRVTITNED